MGKTARRSVASDPSLPSTKFQRFISADISSANLLSSASSSSSSASSTSSSSSSTSPILSTSSNNIYYNSHDPLRPKNGSSSSFHQTTPKAHTRSANNSPKSTGSNRYSSNGISNSAQSGPTILSSTTPRPFINTTARIIEREAAERQKIRDEFFATYDVMTGVRIAATLGGFFGLMVFLVVYKSRGENQETIKALKDPKIAAVAAAVMQEEEDRELQQAMEAAGMSIYPDEYDHIGGISSGYRRDRLMSVGNISAPPVFNRGYRFSSIGGGGYSSLLGPPPTRRFSLSESYRKSTSDSSRVLSAYPMGGSFGIDDYFLETDDDDCGGGGGNGGGGGVGDGTGGGMGDRGGSGSRGRSSCGGVDEEDEEEDEEEEEEEEDGDDEFDKATTISDDTVDKFPSYLSVPLNGQESRRSSNITCCSSDSSYLERRCSAVTLGLVPLPPISSENTSRRPSATDSWEYYYPGIQLIKPTPKQSPCLSEQDISYNQQQQPQRLQQHKSLILEHPESSEYSSDDKLITATMETSRTAAITTSTTMDEIQLKQRSTILDDNSINCAKSDLLTSVSSVNQYQQQQQQQQQQQPQQQSQLQQHQPLRRAPLASISSFKISSIDYQDSDLKSLGSDSVFGIESFADTDDEMEQFSTDTDELSVDTHSPPRSSAIVKQQLQRHSDRRGGGGGVSGGGVGAGASAGASGREAEGEGISLSINKSSSTANTIGSVIVVGNRSNLNQTRSWPAVPDILSPPLLPSQQQPLNSDHVLLKRSSNSNSSSENLPKSNPVNLVSSTFETKATIEKYHYQQQQPQQPQQHLPNQERLAHQSLPLLLPQSFSATTIFSQQLPSQQQQQQQQQQQHQLKQHRLSLQPDADGGEDSKSCGNYFPRYDGNAGDGSGSGAGKPIGKFYDSSRPIIGATQSKKSRPSSAAANYFGCTSNKYNSSNLSSSNNTIYNKNKNSTKNYEINSNNKDKSSENVDINVVVVDNRSSSIVSPSVILELPVISSSSSSSIQYHPHSHSQQYHQHQQQQQQQPPLHHQYQHTNQSLPPNPHHHHQQHHPHPHPHQEIIDDSSPFDPSLPGTSRKWSKETLF